MLETPLPSSSCRRTTRRHSPPSLIPVLLPPVASILACTSLAFPFSYPSPESNSVFQRPRIRQQHQWTVPGGAVRGDRYQPGLGILSPDWPLPKGHGFRRQPWKQVRCVPGSCHGEHHCSDKFFFYISSVYISSGAKRNSHFPCNLDSSVLHISGSHNHRWWHESALRALKYHRAAG